MSEAEAKTQSVNFSLPYRPGMELEPGFVNKGTAVSKTFPDDKEFAKFKFPLDTSKPVDQAKALEVGTKVILQNEQRANLIGQYAKKYSIVAPGIAGGITQTEKKLISAMWELTQDVKKIQAAMKKKTGKDFTPEEITENK